ncbi:hypothetical protein CROQUDRAFT_94949 [Cronartium quercuum f. sp. fusiforme G11]|uniref:Uncharacterized protein n=1 Tax=Cronartium quercuum f. sp. fusiforme G11 TaxID=708437 RepID=A0A9P6TBC3_9BASI|nr:hypothetical protein CROQUDRAFT_94949 [Cronartium quercuum f. sp. fusiforme G11]
MSSQRTDSLTHGALHTYCKLTYHTVKRASGTVLEALTESTGQRVKELSIALDSYSKFLANAFTFKQTETGHRNLPLAKFWAVFDLHYTKPSKDWPVRVGSGAHPSKILGSGQDINRREIAYRSLGKQDATITLTRTWTGFDQSVVAGQLDIRISLSLSKAIQNILSHQYFPSHSSNFKMAGRVLGFKITSIVHINVWEVIKEVIVGSVEDASHSTPLQQVADTSFTQEKVELPLHLVCSADLANETTSQSEFARVKLSNGFLCFSVLLPPSL